MIQIDLEFSYQYLLNSKKEMQFNKEFQEKEDLQLMKFKHLLTVSQVQRIRVNKCKKLEKSMKGKLNKNMKQNNRKRLKEN